jgi:hypothetical protein
MTNIWTEAYKEVREPFFEMEDPYTNLSEEKKEKEKEEKGEKEESEDAGEDQEHKYKKSGKKSKDYDGDGEVEDESDEYAGVKDKAIKKAMKEERDLHSKKGKNEQVKEMPSGKRNKVEINPSIKEEVEEWVNYLISEGYDLSEFTWEELEEIYVTEARDGYGDDSKFNKPDDRIKRPGTDVPKPKKGGYGRITSVMPKQISGHATRTISANTKVRGEDPGAPRSQKIAKTTKLVKKDGKWVKNEEVIAWVEDLIQEGYDFSELTWDEVFDLYEETMVNDGSSKRKAAQAQIRKELADVQLAKANAAAQKQTNESVIIYLENRYNL